MALKIDIHNHILPESWPDLKQVSDSFAVFRVLRLFQLNEAFQGGFRCALSLVCQPTCRLFGKEQMPLFYVSAYPRMSSDLTNGTYRGMIFRIGRKTLQERCPRNGIADKTKRKYYIYNGLSLSQLLSFFCQFLSAFVELEKDWAKFPHSPILHYACGSIYVVLCFATKKQQKQRIVPQRIVLFFTLFSVNNDLHA